MLLFQILEQPEPPFVVNLDVGSIFLPQSIDLPNFPSKSGPCVHCQSSRSRQQMPRLVLPEKCQAAFLIGLRKLSFFHDVDSMGSPVFDAEYDPDARRAFNRRCVWGGQTC